MNIVRQSAGCVAVGMLSMMAAGARAADPAPARGPTPAHETRPVDLEKFPLARPGLHPSEAKGGDRLRVLLLTGQMNKYHRWEETTPYLRSILEGTGRFRVDVETLPPFGADLAAWAPRFEDYAVVLMNLDGDYWPEATRKRFEDLVRSGRVGLSVVHSADNAWKEWGEWNEMIAVGGWGARDVSAGPYLRWRDGGAVRDDKPGPCGGHGARKPFVIIHRTPDHPIARGLPVKWRHHEDELYNCLRGPAKQVQILGTAWSDPANKGTGEDEPMLMAVRFGQGRIFHTTLGHDVEAMRCAGFQCTLQRGTEWAATGAVTLPVPDDFPTETEPRLRPAP